MLTRLLDTLARQESREAFTYSVVICDNDLDESARAAVDAFQRQSTLDVIYTMEPRRNIALARNEAVATRNPLLRTGLLLTGAGDLLKKTRYNYNLDNGILTAYEAMSLNLDQTDLVVLSACETGLGDVQQGEGVYGLQRAFLVAGAKVLVMSMFRVDDEATRKLMLRFYQNWLASGRLRESFTTARKELRNDYPEPLHWGAFLMIGLE